MRSSVNGALGPMELESVQGPACSGLKSLQDWKALVGRAMGRSSLSQKQVAAAMEITPQQLSNQLSPHGKEHLSFWRMASLPPEFWHELVLLIVDFHQLTLAGTEQDRRDLEVGRAIREALQRSVAR